MALVDWAKPLPAAANPVPPSTPTSPIIAHLGLGQLGQIQAIGGLALGLIALFYVRPLDV